MSGLEIERKFLVKKGDSYKREAYASSRIRQGYFAAVNTVRVRIRDDKAYLTIKGPSRTGLSRYEFEKEITLDEANHLMELCEPGVIDKTRYLVPMTDGHVFEVDEFYGENDGLVIAEVELKAEDEPFLLPPFIEREVTGDRRYYNSHLTTNPYTTWS